jgi:hypothetical protein
VNLDFLFEILQIKGFSDRWIKWIARVVRGGGLGGSYPKWF